MTDLKTDPETAARLAREILEQNTERRVDAVRSIIAATNALDDAEQITKDARDAHGRAWADAISTGWSDKDLRATGARHPSKAQPHHGPNAPTVQRPQAVMVSREQRHSHCRS